MNRAPLGRRAVGEVQPGPQQRRIAERRAEALLRSVVNPCEWEMYCELGFLRVAGAAAYAYLIYPHKPMIAYSTTDGELLSEYCVVFAQREREGALLPAADDVLAKWLALRGNERALMSHARVDAPGRQLDPNVVRADLLRLEHWQAANATGSNGQAEGRGV